jgi:hypothetical protein
MRYFFALILALFIWTASGITDAQVRTSINFNMDRQPAWGPTGYDYVEYYYLPDLDVYYGVPQHRYYYIDNGRWISSYNLPHRYQGYNLYNSYKVVVNEKEPWRNNSGYRENYSKYRNRHDQQPIRDTKDPKYFQNKYHPQHKNWVKQQKQKNANYKRNNSNSRNNGNNSIQQKQNSSKVKGKNNNGHKKKDGKGNR